MEMSKVYYTNLRTRIGDNLLQKLERLIKTAGIGDIDFEDKYTAIKMHFGEPGNLAFLRPNYAKTVADVIKVHGFTKANSHCFHISSCHTTVRRHSLKLYNHSGCANVQVMIVHTQESADVG